MSTGLLEVQYFIDKLEADFKQKSGWKELTEEHISRITRYQWEPSRWATSIFSFGDDFDKRKLWNIADERSKRYIIKNPVDVNFALKNTTRHLIAVCNIIPRKFEYAVRNKSMDNESAMKLLRFLAHLRQSEL